MDEMVAGNQLPPESDSDAHAASHAGLLADRDYRLLFEVNPLPLLLFDPESLAIVAANTQAAQHYGYVPNELTGLPIVELAAPEDQVRWLNTLSNLNQGSQYLGAWLHNRKDGSLSEVRSTIHNLTLSGRHLRLAVIQETGDRRNAETLRRLALRAFDNIAEGITIADAQGNIIAVNNGFTRITGFSVEEVIGRNPRILQSGLQNRAFYAEMWDAITQHGYWRGEIVNRRKSGELYKELLSISAVRDGRGNVENYIGVFADLSERLKHASELREVRERLDLALDAGTVGTWSWQIGGEGAHWDERMDSLLGITKHAHLVHQADLLGHIDPDDRARVTQELTQAAADRTAFQRKFRVILPGGETRVLEVKCKPVFDEFGNAHQMIGVAWDITEQHHREAEIRELNASLDHRVRERTAELKSAMDELDAFSYSVAHDLRSPLRSLDGFSQLLLTDHADELNEEGRNYLQRIRASSQHLAELIDDLLQLSRVTRTPMERVSVDLSEIANDIAKELQAESAERRVEFVIERQAHVLGDPLLLRLLMENLLGNAWKYTSKTAQARIEFGMMPIAEGEHGFFVRDNGAGFDMAFVGKLFQPFQRLHHAADFPGSGIGLASAHRVIGRHGGRIWAEGAAGLGACFYFALPAAHNENEGGATAVATPAK